MKNEKLVIYLPEGFADWESAYLLPELAQNNIPYIIAAESHGQVSSIGRLKITPECVISEIQLEDISGIVLIGGDSWQNPKQNTAAIELAKNALASKRIVAAICAATLALAREGILSNYKHTSNDLQFLKYFLPNYKEEENYISQLAVVDRNLITAAGHGAIEFTLEIMKALNIYTDKKRAQWFDFFKNGIFPPNDFWT